MREVVVGDALQGGVAIFDGHRAGREIVAAADDFVPGDIDERHLFCLARFESDGRPGWDRTISGAALRVAMNASDQRYAYTAVAVGR